MSSPPRAASSAKPVFVTGATGYIGARLVPRLLEAGYSVRCFARSPRKVIEALRDEGLRDGVKVMVGGAPVGEQWARQIGADGYAEDAVGAVELAKRLVASS